MAALVTAAGAATGAAVVGVAALDAADVAAAVAAMVVIAAAMVEVVAAAAAAVPTSTSRTPVPSPALPEGFRQFRGVQVLQRDVPGAVSAPAARAAAQVLCPVFGLGV